MIPPLAALCVGALMALTLTNLNVSTNVPANNPAQASAFGAQEGSIAPLFTPEVQHWAASIARWSHEFGVDPNLAATVMQIESCGDPRARSRAGAMGLFQVMPFHFEAGEDGYQPDTNALRGLGYLARSLSSANGDVRLALAGYNGGISVIRKSETAWAAETRRYAYWGSGIYADAAAGKNQSARLEEWLRAGGASLCRQAAERLGINK